MQDLEVIQRLNAEASAAEIPQLQAAGKFVVCVYVGLNYFSHEGFATEAEARAYIDKRTEANTPGERTQLLPPTKPAEVEVDTAQGTEANTTPTGGADGTTPAESSGTATTSETDVAGNTAPASGGTFSDTDSAPADAS